MAEIHNHREGSSTGVIVGVVLVVLVALLLLLFGLPALRGEGGVNLPDNVNSGTN